jgi:hypothetical protein
MADGHQLIGLDRSLWINVSFAAPKRGYWGSDFVPPAPPTEIEIRNASGILVAEARPNQIYLVYHHELPVIETGLIRH